MSVSEDPIYGQLTEIFQAVFDEDDLVVTPAMTADDVSGWDSLSHVRLILTVSKTFGIKFSASEMASFKNVGELATAISKKCN
ncbi:MAG: acyl carrier protein [Pseudomonas sp.]|jgi:acyl carrier protein|uniref:acyl carrier protein n=1 Tax=Pseudomonas sp. TaxID=306 RepID=UPI00260A6505|nr:acyl carrier protein [Pseudomonas sp.]MDB6048047.1 acyl carrier protein [Pseudomonas sp.]